MSEPAVSVRILRLPHAGDLPLPAYETPGSAGMDVRAAVDAPVTLEQGAIALVPTGFAVEVPAGFEMQVRPRSGLAARHGITLPNSPATIDSDYRGEVRVIVQNLGWAAGYNVVAIPLAAGVLAGQGIVLHPAFAAVLMSTSTIIVALNAQLLRRVPLGGSR